MEEPSARRARQIRAEQAEWQRRHAKKTVSESETKDVISDSEIIPTKLDCSGPIEIRLVKKDVGTTEFPVRPSGIIDGTIIRYLPNGKIFRTLDVECGYPVGPRRTYVMGIVVAEFEVIAEEPITFDNPLFYLEGKYALYNSDGSVREAGIVFSNATKRVVIEGGRRLSTPKVLSMKDTEPEVEPPQVGGGESSGPGFSFFTNRPQVITPSRELSPPRVSEFSEYSEYTPPPRISYPSIRRVGSPRKSPVRIPVVHRLNYPPRSLPGSGSSGTLSGEGSYSPRGSGDYA